MAGEHFFDGFLGDGRKEEGKRRVAEIVARLNKGEALTAEDVERELAALERTA